MRPKKQINVEIGANIQAAREKAGYTQEKLSELIGVSPNHMSAIERGVSAVSLDALRTICGLFAVSADSIIFGRENPSDEMNNIARQLARVNPKYKPQISKLLSDLLELSTVIQNEENKTE